MSRRSAPAPRRAPRVARAALALLCVVALGACAHQRNVPGSYGDTTERNFTEGCVDGLTSTSSDIEGEPFTQEEAQQICGCSYDGIVETVPYERFQEIMDDQESEPGPLPDELAGPVEGCRSEVRPA